MTLTTCLEQAPLVSLSLCVTVPLLQVSVPVGDPVAAGLVSPGHSTVASAGKFTKLGALVSLTVMVWARLALLPQASVTVQVRVITLTTWLEQAPLVSLSLCVTVALLQVSVPVGAPVAAGLVSPGHSTIASAGKFTKLGALVSLTVMVWAWLALLPQASVTVQVRVITLTTWLEQAPLVSLSLCVTVPLLQVSVPVGAPVAAGLVSPGHSTIASAGKFTKLGALVSLTVMVWARLALLPQASVTVQVRVMTLTTWLEQAPLVSLSLCVTVPLLQVSVPVGDPVAAGLVSPGHSTVASAGKFTKLGAVVSLSVMVWAWLALLPQASVTIQVRVMTLTT